MPKRPYLSARIYLIFCYGRDRGRCLKTPNMKILLIEDDKDITELITYNLAKEKFSCEVCKSGSEGLKKAPKILPDLIILDLMLPDIGGLDICKTLKNDPKTKNIPVMMLTAKGEEIDRVVGFEVGADDYLTKPFSTRELILRLKAILKRSPKEPLAQTLKFGSLEIDPQKYQVKIGDQEIKLTVIEYKLLQHLLSSKGRVFTRDALLDVVWGYDAALTTRTVDTHIKRLRAKLGDAGDYIETIRGVGYRFKEKP